MAHINGGRADKLGNRYEGRWIIKQYLRLLNEEIKGITIEAIGEAEYGVDLWITDINGQLKAFQCKARNGSNESWSAGDSSINDLFSIIVQERPAALEFNSIQGI